ncbi:hypothetical protein IJG91_02670 [Candidatus Saccharibacteria bacterium]|nr:hypothetical protein [Candidatus Saccharibacteria bacterium]
MRKLGVAILAIVIAAFAGFLAITPVMAENAVTKEACASDLDEAQKAALGCSESGQAPNIVQGLINGAITIVGIVAVVMIVVAGQRYATSSGEPGQIEQARNMLIYSLVGLIIAILAFAIVNFVLGGIFGSST